MTRATVNPGVCGFTTVIIITRLTKEKVEVIMESDCKKVIGLGVSLTELGWKEVFKPYADSRVYQCAALHGLHSTCPIPLAILKGIEVEAGLALPRDTFIHFEKSENDRLEIKK